MDKYITKIYKRTNNQASRFLSKYQFINEFNSLFVNDRRAKSFPQTMELLYKSN